MANKHVTKARLTAGVNAYNDEITYVITTIINSITAKGQRKKLLKDPKVKAILDKYGISVE